MSSMLSEAEAPPAAPPSATGTAQSAGAWLRATRQAQGLHIAALAAQLKVPQSKLEALEGDRFEDLPDMTFARALAKAMCRALKVDAAPVLALLPRGSEAGLDRVSLGLNQPFRERPGREDAAGLDWLKRPLVWSLAGLLLAALLVYTLPAHWLGMPGAGDAATADAPAPAAAVEAPLAETAASAAVPGNPPEPQASATALPAATAPAATTAPATNTPAVTAAAVTAVPAAAPASVAPAPLQAGQVPLRVRASAESWVEISDAKGQVLLSKLMRPGEQAELGVLPPLRLRVGNVSGTEITLRGAAVDLAAQARDNVARLELN